MNISIPKTNNSGSRRRCPLSELNVIDSFMFTTLLSREDTKHKVCDLIMSEILGREFKSAEIHAEHVLPGQDTDLHGIRLDAYFYEDGSADVFYDLEPDNNDKDKSYLPKRNRFYSSLIDSRNHNAGESYGTIPELVIIMILSYDPFGAGDLYYEASTSLVTHEAIPYNDGIRRVYLYADGRNNLKTLKERNIDIFANGQNMQDMVQYICHSDSKHVVNQATITLDGIVNSVRKDQGVSMLYEVRVLEENRRIREEAYEEKDNYYKPIIEEKEMALADTRNVLADREAALADMRNALADREAALADIRNALADRDAEILRLQAQLPK